MYKDICSFILVPDTHSFICDKITKELADKEIDVDGLDCDRKGVCEGFEYEEVYIDDISEVDFEFSSVDNITDDTVSITLSCIATICATCSYFDEANSAWDQEVGEYIYSEWGSVEEKHQPNFDCEVFFSVNRSNEETIFKIKSIHLDVELDQWTRVSRRYIDSENPAETAKAEEMEALEEYCRH